MSNLASYNTDGVEPTKSFEPLPPGWYTAIVTDSQIKDTKAGTGKYLNVRLDICEGKHEGRVVFDKMNVENPNQQAVEIGYRQLAGLKLACGKPHATDSSELHDIPVAIRLKIAKAREGYEPANEVTEYRAIGNASSAPAQAAKPAQAAPAASPTKASTPPWKMGGAR